MADLAAGFFPVGREYRDRFTRLEQRIRLAIFSSDVDPSVVFVSRSRLFLGLLVQRMQKIRVVAACEGEKEALSVFAIQSSGLLILSDDVSNGASEQIVIRAKALHPDLRVMTIVQYPESYQSTGLCHAVIADSDLGRDCDDYPVQQGMMAMLTNTRYLSPAMSSLEAAQRTGQVSPSIPFAQLTSREIDILRCYVRGYTNKESAQALNLSTETVKTYSSRLLSKLGVSNRLKALQRASALGLDRMLSDD